PQPQPAGVPARVTQAAAFPPGVTLLPGRLVRAAAVESRRGGEEHETSATRHRVVERRVVADLRADRDAELDAAELGAAELGAAELGAAELGAAELEDAGLRAGRSIGIFVFAEMPLALDTADLALRGED